MMDAKALAKSKRAHSQHHNKKAHTSQKPKSATEGNSHAANVKKMPNKQVNEKTRQAQRIAKLPSNWDRYEDEFDLGSDDVSDVGATQASDVIVPKSKGADYHHLIAEAQSQFQSYHYSESIPSLDDVLPGDFNQFVGSMLSVRGESMLSWIGDDNFVVEDRTTATQETSVLSLNLNALAEQLERVDLSQRLFIEADLLPSELVEGSEELSGNQQSDEMQMISEKKVTMQTSKEQALDDFPEKLKIADQDSDYTSLGSGSKHITWSNGELDLVNQAKDDLASNHLGKADGVREPKSTAEDEMVSKKKLLTFEAATAEAELDMLLDSFSKTKFLDSPGMKPANTSSTFRKEVTEDLLQVSRKGPESSRTSTITASFDDVLDDLLQETSNLVNQSSTSQPQDMKATPRDNQSSLSSVSVSKSKVLDDFDLWLDTI